MSNSVQSILHVHQFFSLLCTFVMTVHVHYFICMIVNFHVSSFGPSSFFSSSLLSSSFSSGTGGCSSAAAVLVGSSFSGSTDVSLTKSYNYNDINFHHRIYNNCEQCHAYIHQVIKFGLKVITNFALFLLITILSGH